MNVKNKIRLILVEKHNKFTWAIWPEDSLRFFFVRRRHHQQHATAPKTVRQWDVV